MLEMDLSKELKFIHNNKIIPSFEIPEVAFSAWSASLGLLLDVVLLIFEAGSSLGITKNNKEKKWNSET